MKRHGASTDTERDGLPRSRPKRAVEILRCHLRLQLRPAGVGQFILKRIAWMLVLLFFHCLISALPSYSVHFDPSGTFLAQEAQRFAQDFRSGLKAKYNTG
jgi:hypothetical protein